MNSNSSDEKSNFRIITTKEDHRKTSEILHEIANHDKEYIHIEELLAKLGDRGFGLILLVFALPNAIPFPIPGASALTGIPLLFLATQLALGKQKIWMPNFVAKRAIPMDKLRKIIHIGLKGLAHIEKISKPRLDKLTTCHYERLAGMIIFVLSFLMALPIPLGNFPLGLAITLLALAITEQDGLLMIIGWIASILALLFFFTLVNGYAWLLWEMLSKFLHI